MQNSSTGNKLLPSSNAPLRTAPQVQQRQFATPAINSHGMPPPDTSFVSASTGNRFVAQTPSGSRRFVPPTPSGRAVQVSVNGPVYPSGSNTNIPPGNMLQRTPFSYGGNHS